MTDAGMLAVRQAGVGEFRFSAWSNGPDDRAGTPAVYLHGFERHPGDAAFLQRLGEGRRLVAPELPGYGSSTGFEHLVDLTDLVLALRALLGTWSDGPVDLIGHSLGGMVAAELAALCPGVVRRLVLVDAFGLWLDDEPAVDPFGQAERLRAALWAGPPPTEVPTNFVPVPDDPHAAIVFNARNLAIAAKFLWPLPDRGLRRRAPYIEAATLVVNGEGDGLVPVRYAAELARLIPVAALATIPDAGHYPMVEQPDRFHEIVEGFLR